MIGMIEDPDPFAIPDPVLARIREVVPHNIPDQARPEDRTEAMPYQRPEGLLPVGGEREFDVSVLDHAGPTVKVMAGNWMGIRASGATNAGTRRAYHTLTVANGDKIYLKLDYHELIAGGTLTILAGALPSDDPANGIFYQQLASVSIAAGIISVSQTRWGPFGYAGRLQHLREFDVSVLSDAGPSVTVMGGSWMGIKGAGGFYGPSRNEAFFLYVANGDTVYVKLDRGAGTLTYHAGATVPGNSPELGLYYTALATVSIAAGRITVAQTRWGPLEYLPPYVNYFPLDDSSSATAHTDYWANYKPYDASGVLRNGYNAVTWTGPRYYQSTVGTITISGTTLHIIETKVFDRTKTTDSNGGTSDISAEFLKTTWTWLSDTAI
jgi:hypothetical protein